MSDQEIQILIKAIYDGQGTSLAEKDLEKLGQAADAGSKEAQAALDKLFDKSQQVKREVGSGLATKPTLDLDREKRIQEEAKAGERDYNLFVEQMAQVREESERRREKRELERIEAQEKAKSDTAQREAQRRFELNQRLSALPQGVGAPPAPGGDESLLGYGARRHLGAVAGQVLGMPGLGTAVATGGMMAGVGAAVIGIEKLIALLHELGETGRKIEDLGRGFATVGDKLKDATNFHRELNRETELFNLQLSFIEKQVNNTAAYIAQLNELREHEAQLNIRFVDAVRGRERENTLLETRLVIMERLRQLGELDKETAALTLEREIAAQERRIELLEEQHRVALKNQEERKRGMEAEKAALAEQEAALLRIRLEQGQSAEVATTLYKAYDELRRSLEKVREGQLLSTPDLIKNLGVLARAGEPGFAEILTAPSPLAALGVFSEKQGGLMEHIRNRMRTLGGQVVGTQETVGAQEAQVRQEQERLNQEKTKIAEEEQNIQQAIRDRAKEQKKLEELREILPRVLDEMREGIDIRTRREQLDAIPPVNIGPTQGGASVGNEQVIQLLQQIASNTSVWLTEGTA